MKRRTLLILTILAVTAALSWSVTVLASGWTPYATPLADVGWGSNCRFDTFQLLYYKNNTSSSVTLQKTGQYIYPTASCSITGGAMYVEEGSGVIPTHMRANFPEPVDPGDSWTAWWNQGEYAYDKEGHLSHVQSGAHAGQYGHSGILAGHSVFFLTNGTIEFDVHY